MRIVEKSQLMSAAEIDRTLQRLAHQIVEKSGGTKSLALIGIRRRGVPLAQRIARGHREMPIEAQYVGRTVQTSDTEIIEVRLIEIDKEERVVLVDRID